MKLFAGTQRSVQSFTVILCFFMMSIAFPAFSQGKNAVPVWRSALGGMMIGNPVSQVESVAIILDSGNLNCYSRRGNFLWSYFAGGKLTPFLTRSREGTSYICRTNGTFIAVNRAGRELWHKRLEEPIAAPVIIGWDGRIFIPTAKKLFCYTAAGNLLWYKTFDTQLILAPEKDLQGGVILVREGGEVFHINHLGKEKRFDLAEIPALIVPVLVNTENEFYTEENFDTNTEEKSEKVREASLSQYQLVLISANRNGELTILGEENDHSLPQLPNRPLRAVSRNGNIAFSIADNRIILMSYRDKSIVWTGETQALPTENEKTPDMLYDERGIYVISQNGASGFTEDGRRLWTINILGSAAMPVFGGDGLLYSGGTDWILYAYRLEERILGVKQSVYGPQPEGSYGLGNPGPSSWSDYPYRNDETEIRRELAYIAETILAGKTGTNEAEFAAYLIETSGNAVSNIRRGISRPSINAAQRVRALQLLSFIGSWETIPFLVHIFENDPEPLVQAAAAAAIGKIGVDPDGRALKAFSTKIYSAATTQKDAQVLGAAAIAAASLCRFSGPPLSDDGITFLLLLANPAMPRSVQNIAKKELETLR